MPTSNEPRYIAVPKYFTRSPKPPDQRVNQTKIGIGCLSIIIGVIAMIDEESLPIGIILFLGGAWLALTGFIDLSRTNSIYKKEYERTEPKPSDTQMDAWKAEDLSKIKGEALEKLDLQELSEEQIGRDLNKPIMVIGPGSSARAQIGQDGIIRFSQYDILIVHLTAYHLAAYKCTLDLATASTTNESTQEYHYMDVVSVSTQTDNSGLFALMVGGETKPVASYQKFALSVASGEQIQVAMAFPQLEHIIKNGRLAPTGAEEAIKVIRSRLREMRGGTQG